MLEVNRVHEMDALQGMSMLDGESVDLIVTDPPYNIAADHKLTVRHGKLMSTKEAWGQWDTFDPCEYDAFIGRVLDESFRVLKPGGALYMFTAREDNGFFAREAVKRGFVYRNQLALVRRSPLPSMAKKNWRSGFELCLYVTKGKPRVFNFLSQKECVNVSYYHSTHKHTDHPTEKPLADIRRIVMVSSSPGDLVLDPFMGSGTTAAAAVATGRRFIGFDFSPEYVRMARDRLRRIVRDDTKDAKEAA